MTTMKHNYGEAIDALDADLARLQAEHLRLQDAVGAASMDRLHATSGTDDERQAARERQKAEYAKLRPQFDPVRARLAAVHARLAGEYAELVARSLDDRDHHA